MNETRGHFVCGRVLLGRLVMHFGEDSYGQDDKERENPAGADGDASDLVTAELRDLVRILDGQVAIDAEHNEQEHDRALTQVDLREIDFAEGQIELPATEVDRAHAYGYGEHVEEVAHGQVEQVQVGDRELLAHYFPQERRGPRDD